MKTNKRLILVMAVTVTGTAIAMAALAALDRGGLLSDQILLVVMSVMITALAHLLPSLTRNKLAWIVWAGCLVVTIYGHLTFFSNASIRAGEVRAQNSLQAHDMERQIESVTRVLEGIVARPVTVIARDLSITQDYRARLSLKKELKESERAVSLSEQLLILKNEEKLDHVTQSKDKVTALLSSVTGSNESAISLLTSLACAVLIELAGALLWHEVLRESNERSLSTASGGIGHIQSAEEAMPSAVVRQPEDTLSKLEDAVKRGLCKPTVASIRVFVGCGQARAVALRKQLMEYSQLQSQPI